MTAKDKENLRDKLEWEGGFEYLITGSDFKEIKDPKFHILRRELKAAWLALDRYIGGGFA